MTSGTLPYTQIGHQIRFHPADVHAFVQAQKKRGTV
jgi:hypothetical protein